MFWISSFWDFYSFINRQFLGFWQSIAILNFFLIVSQIDTSPFVIFDLSLSQLSPFEEKKACYSFLATYLKGKNIFFLCRNFINFTTFRSSDNKISIKLSSLADSALDKNESFPMLNMALSFSVPELSTSENCLRLILPIQP